MEWDKDITVEIGKIVTRYADGTKWKIYSADVLENKVMAESVGDSDFNFIGSSQSFLGKFFKTEIAGVK